MTTAYRKRSSPKKKTAKRPPHGKAAQRELPFYRLVIRGFLFTLGIAALLLLVASLALCFLPDPTPLIAPLGYACCFLSVFIGGFICGNLHKKAPAVCGSLNGLCLLALMLLLSFFFRSFATPHPLWLTALLYAAVPITSVLGALAGVR